MTSKDDSAEWINATETSLQIIEALIERNEAGVTELAADLGIANSTAYRHLQTLKQLDYVVYDEGAYQIAYKPLLIGDSARKNILGFKFIKRHIDTCHKQTDARVQFIIEEDGYGVTIYRARSEKSVTSDVHLGERFYLSTSAAGKAILAKKPKEETNRIINNRGLPSETETSITDKKKLMKELEKVRDRGYSINRSEHISGLWAVGVDRKSVV